MIYKHLHRSNKFNHTHQILLSSTSINATTTKGSVSVNAKAKDDHQNNN